MKLTYIYFGDNLEDIKIYVDGELLEVSYMGNFNKMIQLGRHEVSDTVRVEIEEVQGYFSIFDIFLYYENDEIFKQYYNVLSKEQMELKQISGRIYEGNINIKSENEYVLFTIPYDNGWKMTVDR